MSRLFFIFFLLQLNYCFGQEGGHIRESDFNTKNARTSLKNTKYSAHTEAIKWKSIIEINKSDANAWLNYYIWTDRDKMLYENTKKQIINKLINDAAQFISGTWQNQLITFLHSGKKDTSALKKALALTNDKKTVYPYAVQYAIIVQDKTALKEYTAKLNVITPLHSIFYEYHYNTLQSAGLNATIYAKGLNDLVPLAILQNVYKVRTDIQLRYYDDKITIDDHTYLCLSLGKEIIERYSNAVYTGLLIKPNGNINHVQLKETIENKFRLEEIKDGIFISPEEAGLYSNYLPSFILLYKWYVQQNSPAAAEMKNLITKIAAVIGEEENIKNILMK